MTDEKEYEYEPVNFEKFKSTSIFTHSLHQIKSGILTRRKNRAGGSANALFDEYFKIRFLFFYSGT